MLSYTTIGTNNWESALEFYDRLLDLIGATRLMNMDGFVLYGASMQSSNLAIVRPFDGKEATHGNGTMLAFQVASQDMVTEFYRKALELGATDEGAPGSRADGFYGAYCRDLDNNKLCVFVLG